MGSEFTGLYFDPRNKRRAWVNIQHPDSGNDRTIEITLPRGHGDDDDCRDHRHGGDDDEDEEDGRRERLDSIAETSDWIDDDGAAPGVID